MTDLLCAKLLDPDVRDSEITSILGTLASSDTQENSAVYSAFLCSGRISLLQSAIQGGYLNPNFVDDEGNTVIGMCIDEVSDLDQSMPGDAVADLINNVTAALIIVLELGADPNRNIRSDYPPLYLGILRHQPGIVGVLLAFGADPHKVLEDGQSTPLGFAGTKRPWLLPLVERIL